MTEPVLRAPIELFFSFDPSLFFLQGLNLIAALINGILGLFGIQGNVVGF